MCMVLEEGARLADKLWCRLLLLLLPQMALPKTGKLTPKRFINNIHEICRSHLQNIVLPEVRARNPGATYRLIVVGKERWGNSTHGILRSCLQIHHAARAGARLSCLPGGARVHSVPLGVLPYTPHPTPHPTPCSPRAFLNPPFCPIWQALDKPLPPRSCPRGWPAQPSSLPSL
jgi:hypothetical protein